ncbi:MAG: SpoIIE family protein phosphatase [Oscillospiraceae bacterium]|nr:SpoIIE family protein phosphatase [Oscillospiraceae bacterium]
MLKANAETKNENFEMIFGAVVSLIGGFLLSGTEINGTSSFIGVSVCGAVNPLNSMSVLIGSLLRYILAGNIHKNIILLCAMIFIITGKIFTVSFENPTFCGTATAISLFASGLIVSAIIGESIFKILFYLVYSIFAGFTSYFLVISEGSLRRQRVIDLKSGISCAYAVIYIVIIATLSSFDLIFANAGRIFGIAVTLIAGYHYGYTGGVLCGALTTCGIFLSSKEIGMPFVLLSVAGLLSGYIHKNSMTAVAILFNASSILFVVITGQSESIIYCICDLIIGTVLFFTICPNISDKWVVTGKSEKGIGDIISSRMEFLASSISALRDDSEKISHLLSCHSERTDEVEQISDKVCADCQNKTVCWYRNYEEKRRGFKKLLRNDEVAVENFPYELKDCLKKEELCDAFRKNNLERITARLMDMRFSESRKLLFEQIKITEEIILSASEKINVRYSETISKTVRAKLEKYGYKTSNIIAYYNRRNRLLIEIYFELEEAPANCVRICDLISDELKINLDFTEPMRSGREVRVRIFEKTKYLVQSCVQSMCAVNSSESGDTSDVFTDGIGSSYIVLSDGMGSGKSAALESKMVVSMFKKLIVSGVEYLSAIKLINSIMLNKSRNEAFATLDAVKIDMDTCGLVVIKSGASATLIRHKSQVIKITSPTFPIGIIQEAEAFSCEYEFERNDIIIMLSDGISENEYHFIKELLLRKDDLKQIVSEICAKSEKFTGGKRRDDVTVIGIKVV